MLQSGWGLNSILSIDKTFLTALLSIQNLFLSVCRQEKKRDGCCCCIRLRDDYSETACGKRDFLQEVMDKYVGRAMLTLPGKVKSSTSFSISTWIFSSPFSCISFGSSREKLSVKTFYLLVIISSILMI